jgi:hypothetical protein
VPAAEPRLRGGTRLLLALALAVVVIGSWADIAVELFSRSPAHNLNNGGVVSQEATVRQETAAWVVRQVSPDVTVSCDKVMCAALRAHGFPPAKLVVLGPTSADPVASVLVVETAAVKSLLGSSLATAWAPAVLASFGSGTAWITVRVVAPNGAAAYQNALSADLAGRKASGAALFDDPQITVSATARNQLAAGLVDGRLLLVLASLAARQPIIIVQFGNPGPGASPGVPLRFADLAQSVPAAHMGSSSAYERAVRADLNAVNAQIRPAGAVTAAVQGQTVLQVQFTAPSPLGLFSTQGSS